VDINSGAVSGSITVVGLTATAVHVHSGAPGVAGPVIIPLVETPAGSGTWVVPASTPPLTADQISAFTAGNLYFTAANLNGEIRGQINLASASITKFAFLNGAQETPAVTTGANGTGSLAVDIITGKVSGSITVTRLTPSDVRVHEGAAGAPGPTLIHLTETPSGSGTWAVPATAPPLTLGQIVEFLNDGLYFNAPTKTNPDGEIRGQIELATPPVTAVSFSAQIQPIFTANCTTGCHSAGGISSFLSLEAGTSYANLVNVRSVITPQGIRVIPGDSPNSVLFERISGTRVGPQMPFERAPLSTSDQNLIRKWIDQGAPNN
jgi:hypothetical protein